MKALVLSLLAVSSLVSSSYAQAIRAGDVKIEKVSPLVEKTPEFQLSAGPLKRFKSADWLEVEVEFNTVPELIDELSFNFKILINNKLLVGTIDYVAIPKGREHFASCYVSPRSLDAVMGGKNMTAASIQNIWVEATKQGQVIAVLSAQKTAVPNVPQLQGLILNKSQTPFAPLWWDRYEALKPSSK